MRSMPLRLLAILALPVLAVLAPPPPLQWPWLAFAGATLMVAALRFLAQAEQDQEGRRGGLVIIPAAIRFHELTAYGATLGIAAIIALVAIGSVWLALALAAIAAGWVVLWWPASIRWSIASYSTTVARDPGAVFDFLADSRNAPLWITEVVSVEKVTDGPIGPGTRFHVRTDLPQKIVPRWMSREFDAYEEILEYVRPRRLVCRVEVPDPYPTDPNSEVTNVEPVAGGSRISRRYSHLTPYAMAVLGGTLSALRFSGYLNAERDARWERARRVLEGTDQPPTI